jgi:hypothetical protein
MVTRKSQTSDTEAQVQEGAKNAEYKAEDASARSQDAAAKTVEAGADATAKTVETGAETVQAGADAAADAVETAANEVASSSDTAIDTVVLSQQQAMERAEASGQAVVEGVTRMQREIVDFVSERLRHDMLIQQELLRCRNFDEVRSIQARFFQTAMDQYSAEATKLMRMGQEIMQRTLAGAEH